MPSQKAELLPLFLCVCVVQIFLLPLDLCKIYFATQSDTRSILYAIITRFTQHKKAGFVTFTFFSHSHLWTFPPDTSSTSECFLMVALILHNLYSCTPTLLLLSFEPQPWVWPAKPPLPCTFQRNMMSNLKVPSPSPLLYYACWNTQLGFQIADSRRLHFHHFASQYLRNIKNENSACPICLSGEFICSCPMSLWTLWSARWPVILIATWVWEHLISEERLCLKQIVPKEKWSAWKCT